jgi:hypothetical protein
MIAMQPPHTALNPDREGGDTASTALRFWIIFDGADGPVARPPLRSKALSLLSRDSSRLFLHSDPQRLDEVSTLPRSLPPVSLPPIST